MTRRKMTIEIEMMNAAFADGGEGTETAWILKQLAMKFHHAEEVEECTIFDSNGNKVGRVVVSGERDE